VPKNNPDAASNEGDQMQNESQNNTDKVESDKKYKVMGVIDSQDSIVYINSASLDNLNISQYSQLKVKTHSAQKWLLFEILFWDMVFSFHRFPIQLIKQIKFFA